MNRPPTTEVADLKLGRDMARRRYNTGHSMSLALGTRLGSYEILAPLGAGGMGEVARTFVMAFR